MENLPETRDDFPFTDNRFERNRVNIEGFTVIDVAYVADSFTTEEALAKVNTEFPAKEGEEATDWQLNNPTEEQLGTMRGLRHLLEK